jgi:hypothetical protein
MTKTRMLQAVCTFAMLAATPALAQTQNPGSGMTGPNGQPSPAAQQPTPNSSSAGMAPADNGSGTAGGSSAAASATGDSHVTHRSAMAHPTGMVHSRTDRSQDAAVDHLNDQSYQAAQRGQMFGADSGSGSMGSSAPSGPGSMGSSGASGPGTLGSGDTSGGSMPVGSGTSPAK